VRVEVLGANLSLGRVLINAAANVRFQSEVDMIRQAKPAGSVENDASRKCTLAATVIGIRCKPVIKSQSVELSFSDGSRDWGHGRGDVKAKALQIRS
jgi:hypothetical protein